MKIAMLSVHSSPTSPLGTNDAGGMSVYIGELAKELGRQGHRVDIFTRFTALSCSESEDLYENVRLINLRAGKAGYLHKLALYNYLDDFFNELDRYKKNKNIDYDIIHSHYWLSGWVGRLAQKHWKIPHIIIFHTLGIKKNVIFGGEQEPRLRIDTEKELIETAGRIIAFTGKERKDLYKYFNFSPERVGVVPGGVNFELFRPINKRRARERCGFDSDGPILLYVGRFAPLKGLTRLLKSMVCFKGTKNIRLIIVGGNGFNSTEVRYLIEISKKCGVQDMVTFSGRVEQNILPYFYSAADLLVLPSRYESFGLVALEALACGTPVVATQVGGMKNIIKQGETGFLVANGSPSSLAKGVETFLSHPKVMSSPAMRDSIRKYSWANIATKVVDEYLILLNQHGMKNDISV